MNSHRNNVTLCHATIDHPTIYVRSAGAGDHISFRVFVCGDGNDIHLRAPGMR